MNRTKGYFWDTNILTFFGYNPDHDIIQQQIERVSWDKIFLPSVVVSEAWRGRLRKVDAVPKAIPEEAIFPHQQLSETHEILRRFSVVSFDRDAANRLSELQKRAKRQKKRVKRHHADMMIAAMTLSNHFTLVTRNEKDFSDWLPARQLENWIDNPPM